MCENAIFDQPFNWRGVGDFNVHEFWPTKTMMEFPTQPLCQVCYSQRIDGPESDATERKLQIHEIPSFPKVQMTPEHPKLPPWSSSMLAKTNMLAPSKCDAPLRDLCQRQKAQYLQNSNRNNACHNLRIYHPRCCIPAPYIMLGLYPP